MVLAARVRFYVRHESRDWQMSCWVEHFRELQVCGILGAATGAANKFVICK